MTTTKPTKAQELAGRIQYLRQMVRELERARLLDRDEVTDICNEIYGTTNQIEEEYGNQGR